MSKQINWERFSYTKEQLIKAVKTSQSFRQTLLSLGISGEGGGYKPAKRIIKVLNLDTSHWVGQGHLKGKTHNYTPPKSLKEILVSGSTAQSYKLGKRLIKEKLLVEECSICKISEWCDQKLSLHLDHINGINDDNRLENLRLLCPNCHSLTSTYCGKNKRGYAKTDNKTNRKEKLIFFNHPIQKKKKIKEKKKCLTCENKISLHSLRCKSCAARHGAQHKIMWPSIEELILKVKETSYLQTAKELGVSDNAIRKHIKNHKYKLGVGCGT